MPRYEFKCPKCKSIIELDKKISDDTLPLCCEPDCGGIEMIKIMSSTSFVLAGDCWARDGYK